MGGVKSTPMEIEWMCTYHEFGSSPKGTVQLLNAKARKLKQIDVLHNLCSTKQIDVLYNLCSTKDISVR